MAIAGLSQRDEVVAPALPRIDAERPSADTPTPARRTATRAMLAGVLVLAVAGLIWRRAEMIEAARTIRDVDRRSVLAASLLLVIGLVNRGALHRSAHAVLGMPVGLAPMIRVGAAVSAVNKVVRSGGAIGIALFVGAGCRDGRPPERVVMAYLLSSLAGQIALAGLLGPAVLLAHRSGQLPDVWLAVGLGALAYTVVLVAAAFGASRSTGVVARLRALTATLDRPRHANHVDVPQPVGRGTVDVQTRPPKPADAPSEMDLATLIRDEPRHTGRLLAHAAIDKMVGLLTLMVTLVGLGADFEPGVALVSYCVALVSSMVALVPGGIGAVEISLGAALSSAAIPAPVVNSGVLAFRFFDLWMPVLIGLPILRGLNRLGLQRD